MDSTGFTLRDGLMVSLFGTVIVFLLLFLLQLLVMLFRYLPKGREAAEKADTPPRNEQESRPSAPSDAGDDEDALVAMLTASILAREEYGGDVRIRSIKRINEE